MSNEENKNRPGYSIKTGLEKEYEAYTKNNDAYGAACVRYAETWGSLMESRLGKSATQDEALGWMKEHAEKASHEADTEGITGFMYGCAVKELAHFWVHGEALRRWHNKEYGVPEDQPGVVNPAILSISLPEEK